MILGTALLLAALFLVLHNLYADRQSGEQAEAVLSVLRAEIPEPVAETDEPQPENIFSLYEENTVPEMETKEIDGHLYIGYISIPELELELPVMAEWSEQNLKTAPCRYTGSLYTDDLIIAAHNYTTHFGKIRRLSVGSELIFTDVSGKQHCYTVCDTEQIPGTAVETMQAGGAGEWDLTLFTCTLDGQNHVTVRAERK